MRPKNKNSSSFFGNTLVKTLIPEAHPLRQLLMYVDWNAFRSVLLEDCNGNPIVYSTTGRPAWDVITIFKMLFLQIYHPASDAKIEERAFTDLAYRLFLNLPFPDPVPDDSTLSRYRSLWEPEKIKLINIEVIQQIKSHGFVTTTLGLVGDTTHQEAPIQRPTARNLLIQGFKKLISELKTLPKQFLSIEQNQILIDVVNRFTLWHQLIQNLKDIYSSSKEERFQDTVQFLLEILDALKPLFMGENISLNQTIEWKGVVFWYQQVLRLLRENTAITPQGISQMKGNREIISLHDPEARAGQKSKNKRFIGYKIAAVRSEDGFFLDIQTIPGNESDAPQGPQMLKRTLSSFGVIPPAFALDKGFDSVQNRLDIHTMGTQPGIEFKDMGNPRNKHLFTLNKFNFSPESQSVTCPADQTTFTNYNLTSPDRRLFAFSKMQCNNCSLRSLCTTSKTGRTVQITAYESLLARDRAFLNSTTYRLLRKQRWGLEGDYGWAKRSHGLSKTRYRGKNKTNYYNRMIFLILNIKRFVKNITSATKKGKPFDICRQPFTT